VACASALEGWGFTLESIVALYGARAGRRRRALRRTLTAPKTAKKAFGDLVVAPIVKLRALLAAGSRAALALLDKVGRGLRGRTLQTFRDAADAGDTKQLTRTALRALLPLADAVVELAARELPSPLEAQRVRVDGLAAGDAPSRTRRRRRDDVAPRRACATRGSAPCNDERPAR
jgi:translation elongation factor EF-G